MNRYAGWDPGIDIPEDEPIGEPKPPLRGHTLVPKSLYDAERALADRLRPYAMHDDLCGFTLTGRACGCGFDDVLAAYDEARRT